MGMLDFLRKKKLNDQEKILIKDWKDILKHIKKDVAYIWTDEVREDFRDIKNRAEKIKYLILRLHLNIKSEDPNYQEKLKHLTNLKQHLNTIESNNQFINILHKDIKQVIKDIEEEKDIARVNNYGRRLFIKQAAVATAVAVAPVILPKFLQGQSKVTQQYLLVRSYKNIISAIENRAFLENLYMNLETLFKIPIIEKLEFIIQIYNNSIRVFAYSRNKDVIDGFKLIFEKHTKEKTTFINSDKINMQNEYDFYIQFSFNKEKELTLRNMELISKIGQKNFVVHYDKEEAGIRLLIGPYRSVEKASDTAKEMLKNDAVLDVLLTNELGIVSPTYADVKLDFDWEEIVKEIKILEKKELPKVEKRIEKRNQEYKKQNRIIYSFEQLNSIIEEGVDKNTTFYGKLLISLLKAIAWCESTYNPYAIAYRIVRKKVKTKDGRILIKKEREKAGRGLFQLLPETASHKEIGDKVYTEEELFVPATNKMLAIKYINYLKNKIDKYYLPKGSDTKKLELLLAAYNGGEYAIFWSKENGKIAEPMVRVYKNEKNKRYKETRDYVVKVLKQYDVFESGSKP